MKNISVCELEQARDEFMGWCTYCGDLTRGSCESDARDYLCPRCGNNTVYGCEEALMMGFIEIGE